MLHIITGGAGCGKSELLMTKIQEAAARGEKIRTLVPEPFAFTYDKRLYRKLGAQAFNGVTAGSFRSLTADILREIAAEPRDTADSVTKTVVLHSLLAGLAGAGALGYFGTQAEKAGFLPQMTAQLDELMQSGMTPEKLLSAATGENGALSEKLTDLARIFSAYEKELEKRGLHDSLRDPLTAAGAAERTRYFAGTHIFFDEFESFTGDQLAMIAAMMQNAGEIWIALHTDSLKAPEYSRFDAVSTTGRTLLRMAYEHHLGTEEIFCGTPYRYTAPSLAHLAKYLFEPRTQAFHGETAITEVEARDMTLECEFTAAQIRHLLMEGKYRASDIMVVMHDISAYGAPLEAAFRRYKVPYFLDRRRSVLYTAVMKLPLCIVGLMRRSSTDQILTLLKTQLTPLHPNQAAILENYAFRWDIDGAQWDSPFPPQTDTEERQCEESRLTLMEPILAMRKKISQKNDGAKLCEVLWECMDAFDVQARVGGLAAHLDTQEQRAMRRLWNVFTEILTAMHDALGGTELTPRQFGEQLEAVLRLNQIPEVPQMLDGVTVMSAAAARYDAPKVLFVLGVNEGIFPADIADAGFFTENERTRLAEQGIELSRSVRDLCADERLVVYKTLSAPSGQLWLCYPLADESGRKKSPSALLEEVRRICPERILLSADDMGAAFYVCTKQSAYYSFVQDYRMTPQERSAVREMLSRDAEDSARLERLKRRSDPARLRVGDPVLMRRLVGGRMHLSATQINALVECPFKAFCKDGLHLYVRTKNTLGALSGGNLVHYCMEQLFRRYPERGNFLALSPADLQAHASRCTREFLEAELGGAEGKTERFLRQLGRLASRMQALLQHTQEELRQSAFVPDACELVVGRVNGESGTEPFILRLKNGMQICLDGKIDRVDITEQDGKIYLRIVDYKTGMKSFNLADIYYGLNLQMLLYLFALEDDRRKYPDANPAGVLYMPAGIPADRERGTGETLVEYLRRYFRMNGTVLCDRGILTKMEQEIAGVYIPAQRSPDDTGTGELKLTPDSEVFTPSQLARLRKYIEETVKEAAGMYVAGETAPHPVSPQGNGTPGYYADACRYCPFEGICGVTKNMKECFRYPLPEKEALARMKEIINKEG